MVRPFRSFRYAVCPLSRWPEPGITLTVVMPPARARRRLGARMSMASRIRTSGWIGEEPSAPAPPPMWLCVSTRPGMIVRPFASTTWAPAGILTSARRPTATILPFPTTSTPSSRTSPAMVIRRAPVKARGRSCAEAVVEMQMSAGASASASAEALVMKDSFVGQES